MKLQLLQYKANTGWSVADFPNLDSEETLIFIFAAPGFINNPEPIKELAKHYPRSKIIGCSSAGEIYGPRISDNSISVAIAQFEKTHIKIVKTSISAMEDSITSGEKIARELNDDHLRGIFVLSDGLNINGSELVKGLNVISQKDILITGGLAGDGKEFNKTWVVFNGDILTNHVVAVGFYGEAIKLGHGSRGGWDIFGPERRVTRSKNNILYELDGQPALTLYKEYLGEQAAGLPATGLLYPLAIRKDAKDARQLVRTILAVDEADQSLTFAGDVPCGYSAQLMRANFDRLITAADEAGEIVTKSMNGINEMKIPVLAIAVSCVGRRLLLGERTEEETESTLNSLPTGTQQIGFYSYGELSPYTTGSCDLHNQTMTLTAICETEGE